MYAIELKDKKVQLKAKARYYRSLKNDLGVENLKVAFFKYLEDVDIDFLAKVIEHFAEDKEYRSESGAYDVLDEYLDNGGTLLELYSEVAEFLNNFGFFGNLELGEDTVIEFFSSATNKVNLDEKVASALDSGMTEVINKMVKERMEEQAKEAEAKR